MNRRRSAAVGDRLKAVRKIRRIASSSPTAAVNPHDDRQILALDWSIDIEQLAFILRLGVGNATMNFRLVRQQWGGKEKDGKEREEAHGVSG